MSGIEHESQSKTSHDVTRLLDLLQIMEAAMAELGGLLHAMDQAIEEFIDFDLEYQAAETSQLTRQVPSIDEIF